MRRRDLCNSLVMISMVAALCTANHTSAAVKTEPFSYEVDGVTFQGVYSVDESIPGKRPVVLVVHEWWGLTDHAKQTAARLAELGYVGVALDLYGGGKVTASANEAAAWSSALKQQPEKARRRFEAALAALQAYPTVDKEKIAAIGFCFGGTMVLEMARMGLPLKGVVSFHGGLTTNVAEPVSPISTRILLCHGADYPAVPASELAAFEDEMRRLGADWQVVVYGGAKHSFTNPAADSYNLPPAKYDPKAAQRSWEHMKVFLAEIFR